MQLPPRTNVGAEHRFYTEAGKYTGIFWNVSEITAKDMKSLTIYSVAGVLNEAHHAGPLDLKAPNRDDRRRRYRLIRRSEAWSQCSKNNLRLSELGDAAARALAELAAKRPR